MSASDYWEDVILDTLIETNLWIGLSTADPGDDAAGLAEPSGNGYARVAVTAATWAAASGGSKSNEVAIEFPEATGSWGTVTYWCLFDAATSGNLLASGALTSGVAIGNGETARFAIGMATFTQG